MKTNLLGLAAAAAAVAWPGVVLAQSTSLGLNQSAWLQVQGFRPSIDSTLRLDNRDTGARGTTLGLEDDLGLKSHEWLPSLLAGVRFGGDWRAEFEAYSLKRSGTRQLDRSINVDDTVFQAAATVDTHFDTTVYRGSIGYSFFRTPQAEFGASVGVHVTRVRAALSGTGVLEGVVSVDRSVDRAKTVPLPTLGLYGTFALNDTWVLNTRADLLYLKVKESKGRLVNLAANLVYRFTPNVGAGVGYRYVDYNLKRSSGTARGEFDYRYNGPQLLLDVGF